MLLWALPSFGQHLCGAAAVANIADKCTACCRSQRFNPSAVQKCYVLNGQLEHQIWADSRANIPYVFTTSASSAVLMPIKHDQAIVVLSSAADALNLYLWQIQLRPSELQGNHTQEHYAVAGNGVCYNTVTGCRH